MIGPNIQEQVKSANQSGTQRVARVLGFHALSAWGVVSDNEREANVRIGEIL